ncbi:hypothetical protein B0H66DRAFT_134757 [Apodospora peruviana]|uniref:Ilp is an apoptosis inhibitor n=1 Tax=Apodospora peruviana TaxID=516989 RepID=A0AAE0II59_9PEZI|nr:hypothetical protein B0H66DRAFT_134757 [Apodospora peruviana]
MAYGRSSGPSFQQEQVNLRSPPGVEHKRAKVNLAPRDTQPFLDAQFDIFDWHPAFQSCVRYFLDHAQYNGPVQALAAYINIQLPFQKPANPVLSSRAAGSPPGSGGGGVPVMTTGRGGFATASARPAGGGGGGGVPFVTITLLPYLRRLIATGFDFPAVLHGFFGDDWLEGIGPLHEQERRNYLFAAKSASWLKVKESYDMGDEQVVPFLKPLQNVSEKEIQGAETTWSEWLAMQDWMLGPRAPEGAAGAAARATGGGGGARGGGSGRQGHGHHGGQRFKMEED